MSDERQRERDRRSIWVCGDCGKPIADTSEQTLVNAYELDSDRQPAPMAVNVCLPCLGIRMREADAG